MDRPRHQVLIIVAYLSIGLMMLPATTVAAAPVAATTDTRQAAPAPAATTGRGLIGWGDDSQGAVGTGMTTSWSSDVPDPTAVAITPALLGRTISEVVSGSSGRCALADGDVVCWRWHGLPEFEDRTGVMGRGTLTDIDMSDFLTCAVSSGKAYCWGDNLYGQLGNNGVGRTSEVPVPVWDRGALAGRTVQAIEAEDSYACALADGQVFCWGWNYYGQLGNGTTNDSPVPVAVDTGGAVAGLAIEEIATGRHGACARAAGRAFCWGDYTTMGSVVDQQVNPRPVEIDMSGPLKGKTITRIALDGPLACVIAGAKPYCWGANGSGGMGAGSTNQYEFAPLAVVTTGALAGKDVTDLVVGFGTVCVLAAGTPVCWGRNIGGEMGIGSVTYGVEPPTAADTTGALAGRRITKLGGGWWSFFAITADPVSTGLKSRANGRYVVAESAGAAPLIANRTAIGPWEQFDLVRLGDDKVALRSRADNEWVCAENAGGSSLIANRRAIGQWETFTLVKNPDATVSLRSAANGRYVVAENGGGASLIANRTAVGQWEKFDLVTS